ncbi:glycosyltransferase [Desulfovulcanus sp.]
MEISVILATFRRHSILGRTLESFCRLNAHGISWEIILIDNAGDPLTCELADEYKKKLPLKFLIETKPGKNNALNRAISEAKGDLFVFTDDDIISDTDWLIELRKGANRWPEAHLFGGKVLPEWPEDAPSVLDDFKKLPENLLRIAFAILDGPEERFIRSSMICGPNMAVRKSVFEKGYKFNPTIGPNNEDRNYIMGSETEFNYRLENDGYKAVFLPKAVVYHQIRSSQLTKRWFYRRALRAGRGQIARRRDTNVPYLFGCPRYLYRMLLETGIKRLICGSFISRATKLELGYRFWMLKGMITQYRQFNDYR